MAVQAGMCQRCICNLSSGVLSIHFTLFASSSPRMGANGVRVTGLSTGLAASRNGACGTGVCVCVCDSENGLQVKNQLTCLCSTICGETSRYMVTS